MQQCKLFTGASGRFSIRRSYPISLSRPNPWLCNLAALQAINAERETPIKIRQCKSLNNIVEQDHRAIKRQTRSMLGFKSFWSASVTLAGIEIMHMIRKGQLPLTGQLCPAQQFYSLAE